MLLRIVFFFFLHFFVLSHLRLRLKTAVPRAEVVAYLLLYLDPGLIKSQQDPYHHNFGQIICRFRQSKQRNPPRPTRQSPPAFTLKLAGSVGLAPGGIHCCGCRFLHTGQNCGDQEYCRPISPGSRHGRRYYTVRNNLGAFFFGSAAQV